MTAAAPETDKKFSGKAFVQGLAIGLLLLALLHVWLWSQAPRTMDVLQKRLASQTVPVQGSRAAPGSLEAMPEGADHTASAPAVTPLQPAPVEGLYEQTAEGRLPRIDSQSGLTPFQAYRRPFDPAAAAGKPVVSLVLTDLGLSRAASESALEILPPEISFAISPYADFPDTLTASFRAKGHETWLVLPMQTSAYPRDDPGPHTLLTGVETQENLSRLTWLMGRAAGYVGFLGPGDDTFLKAKEAPDILDALFGRGVALAAASPDLKSAAATPYVRPDLWLDSFVAPQDIQDKLQELENTARQNGHAAAVLPPLPLTYATVKAWAETLPQKGIVLAPLSAQALVAQ